jgi:hypothetical protein
MTLPADSITIAIRRPHCHSRFGAALCPWPNPLALRRFATTQALLKKSFRDDPAPALAQLERILADSAKTVGEFFGSVVVHASSFLEVPGSSKLF